MKQIILLENNIVNAKDVIKEEGNNHEIIDEKKTGKDFCVDI